MNPPTINVNLTSCTCPSEDHPMHDAHMLAGRHTSPPILIPCPIPRSVTFEVRLGECLCREPGNRPYGSVHWSDCKGGPIRVSCSISGKDWPSSEVVDVIDADRNTDIGWSSDEKVRILAACRARWALVTALVTGRHDVDSADEDILRAFDQLFGQRDAVFAALANEARLEHALYDAQRHSHALMSVVLTESDGRIGGSPERRHSAAYLSAYVERLIELVGNLEGGE